MAAGIQAENANLNDSIVSVGDIEGKTIIDEFVNFQKAIDIEEKLPEILIDIGVMIAVDILRGEEISLHRPDDLGIEVS